jgi:Tol biopolymer transport system component
VIFLDKPGEKGTVILVISLDMLTKETYQLNDFVNDIDLSHDGRNAIYTHMVCMDTFKPMWLWRIKQGDYQEHKVFGWNKNYFDVMISGPSYSLDDVAIYFSVTWFDSGRNGLARVDRDGNNLQILDTDIPLVEGPEPSPDGSLILVTCAGVDETKHSPAFQICLLDQDGKFIKFVTRTGDTHSSYFFTPDGRHIVYTEFVSGGFLNISKKPKHSLYFYELESGERTLLLDWELGVKGFSNNGQDIIFEGRPNEKSTWGIYLINIDGTNLRHLTYFDEFLEEWYADVEDY